MLPVQAVPIQHMGPDGAVYYGAAYAPEHYGPSITPLYSASAPVPIPPRVSPPRTPPPCNLLPDSTCPACRVPCGRIIACAVLKLASCVHQKRVPAFPSTIDHIHSSAVWSLLSQLQQQPQKGRRGGGQATPGNGTPTAASLAQKIQPLSLGEAKMCVPTDLTPQQCIVLLLSRLGPLYRSGSITSSIVRTAH